MLAGLVDELEQNLALARKADAAFLQRSFHGFERHKRGSFHSISPRRGARLGCFIVGGLSPLSARNSLFEGRQCRPVTAPASTSPCASGHRPPISASFHFHAGRLVVQTIAFRAPLPRPLGSRNLMKNRCPSVGYALARQPAGRPGFFDPVRWLLPRAGPLGLLLARFRDS